MAEKKTTTKTGAALLSAGPDIALDAALAVFPQCWRAAIDPGAAACQAVALGVAFSEAWEAREGGS